jgi:hypothetical protein
VPLFDVVFELIGMASTMSRDEISDRRLEVEIVGFLGREVEEIGHDQLQVRTSGLSAEPWPVGV